MLTVDFDRLRLVPGQRVLDLGCGGGRHTFEAYRRGARVVALDHDHEQLAGVEEMLAAMQAEGQVAPGGSARVVHGDALGLPFPDAVFDRVIAAEVLEHIPADASALAELARVLRPGGLAAVTVPRWLPERICWRLSRAYHEVEGGHVRIYQRSLLLKRLGDAGLRPFAWHHAHALHAPYWWMKCLVGVDNDQAPAVRLYHRLLVWDLMRGPWVTRLADRALNPFIGKSLVVYARKPEVARAAA